MIRTSMLEEKIQQQVCQWLKLQYPNVIFTCDLSSGMKLTIGQAVKASKMRSSRGLPDIFIAEPVNGFHGLFLELKRKEAKVFKMDGSLYNNPHLKEQNVILDLLRKKGYVAEFCIGFDQTIRFIKNYLG